MEKTIKLKIPKKYKTLLITVGDEQHPPTREYVDELNQQFDLAIKKKSNYIIVPYWIKLKVIE